MSSKEVIKDLFGSESEEEDEEEPAEVAEPRDQSASPDDSDDERPLNPSQEKAAPFKSSLEDEELQETSAKRERPLGVPLDLEAPLLAPPGVSEAMKLYRQTNIMSVETRPFDPETFQDEEETYMDVRGERRYRLRQNVIRWRTVQNEYGEEERESNARFVRWSDGSLQLLIGDEVLDLMQHDVSNDKAQLFVRHPGLIQSLGALHTKVTFRPATLSSETHRQMSKQLDQRYSKTAKTQHIRTHLDPEKEKEKLEKLEEERIRNKESLVRKQENVMNKYDKYSGSGGYGAYSNHQRDQQQLDAQYLEELEVDEEEVPDYEGGGRRVDFDEEEAREERILKAKRETPKASRKRALSPLSDDEAAVISAEEDDELPPKQPVPRKRGRQMALDSDSD